MTRRHPTVSKSKYFSYSVLAMMFLAGCGDLGTSSTSSTESTSSQNVGGSGGQGTGGTGATGGSNPIGGSNPTGGSTSTGTTKPEPTFKDDYPLFAQFPEGGIYDSVDHAFYVGSLGDGSVHKVDANTGEETVLFTETAPGAWWTLGMAVDEQRRRLWVCAMEDLTDTDADPAYDGYVWVFDLETGTRQAVFPLSDADPEATCTDLTLTSDGLAYVVDRDFGNVYKVDIDFGASLFAWSDVLVAALIGQNAAVTLPDESAIIAAIYLPSRLARVDLNTGDVLDIDISGDFADAAFLSGADGMVYHDGDLYVAFSSELVKVSPTLADFSSVNATAVDVPDGMTDVVSTPGGLYLLNGQAIRYALDQTPDPFKLTRFVGNL
ncbi:MAG: SMP-30/gluconolactonase/LRE family protein [Polyangiaceae bacterium]|nr:SMP-30/gluconolactonase/LRE family protein [Polyangiaceae bacterium]